MEYEELEEYRGDKTACDNCDREFTEGEMITVDNRGRTFCFSGPMGGCMIAFTLSSGEITVGNTMRFKGSKWRKPANPTPNYPNMPIKKKDPKSAEQENWLRKLLDGLNPEGK